MPDSTYEEAKRCYACQEAGEKIDERRADRPRARDGKCTIHTFICRNDRCKMFDRTWIVQINDDGTIPVRQRGPKEFPNSDRMVNMGKAYIDHLQHEIDEGETSFGH